MTQQPQAKYRHDYRAPDYQITDIDLTFDLDAEKTVVTAISQAVRHGAPDAPLRLDGEDLTLVSLHVNDAPWTAYKEEEGALVISDLPERFTLCIVNEIGPAANTALEGLYQSGDALCTQCEAEASAILPGILTARTYWRDLPPKLLLIKTNIRSCSPMATVLRRASWRMAVTGFSGKIRSRNRVICLRWWPVILTFCAIPLPPVPGVKSRWNCTLTVAIWIARRGQ